MGRATDAINVLHVDDEPDFADMAAEFLTREHERLSIETATSPAEGLELLSGDEFDCVVADYDMPELNGIEFLDRVRDRHPDLPFILFTGKGSESIASEAISAGVTDYLRKDPGTHQYAVLANRIENAVEGHRSAIEAERHQHRIEQVLKTVPACVVQIDYDGQFVYANERAEAVLGLDPSEVHEWTYNDPEWSITDLNGEPIPDEELPFRQVRDSGEPLYGFRHTIEWPDGTRKVLRVNGVPLFDESGEIRSTIFALTDVTERMEHEEELHLMEQIVRTMNDGAVITKEGVIQYTNPRVTELVGYSADELAGESMLEYIAEEHREMVAERHRSRMAGESPPEMYEIAIISETGEEIPVEINVNAITFEGEPATLSLVREITDRKEREAELEQRTAELQEMTHRLEEQYRHLFEEAPVMAVVTRDDDGVPVIEKCNQLFAETLEYTKKEVVGRELAEFYTPESRDELFGGGYERALAGEVVREERALESADGEPVETLLRAVPRYNVREEVTGTLALFIDVSERRALEREKERLKEFTSIVSHDLRNPLNVAQSYAELAMEDGESEHLETVVQAHERMEELIENLLTLAQSGREVNDVEPVDLAELAERCWENVVTEAATLETEIDQRLRVNESRLQQLIENLFRNGIEHGGDAVTVTVGELDDGFFVEDDGEGIPEDEQTEVFDAGYSTAEDGTGFGLSIVEEVAEAHGWEISVTEGREGGARFEITGAEFQG